MNPQDYDYSQAGFDGFLSRSTMSAPMANLSGATPSNNQIAYDRTQVSGMLGDTLQIGGVRIENQAIIINDGENDFFLAGDDQNS